MIEDIGTGVEDDFDAPILCVKIRNQHFNNDRGIHLTNGSDCSGKMTCPTIFQIVARHRCDHDVFQFHPTHRFGNALRLVFLQSKWFRGRHRAKTAGARAPISCDHHRRRALAPALPAIRTVRAFANGVQSQIGDERFGRKENRIGGQTHLDPWRLGRLVQRWIDFRAGHRWEISQQALEKQTACGRPKCLQKSKPHMLSSRAKRGTSLQDQRSHKETCVTICLTRDPSLALGMTTAAQTAITRLEASYSFVRPESAW